MNGTVRLLAGLAIGAASLAHAQDNPPATAAAVPESFDVNEYVVDGNTALQAADIEEAVYPFLGPGKTLNDVNGARDALQKVYQQRGFQSVVVDLPPQQVKGGVIRLQVMENTIGHVRIEGARYHSPSQIRENVPSLAEGTLPNFNQAQTELTQVNRQAGQQVVPLLTPGKLPQTMDVTLKVEDTSPWHGSVELNNDHSVNTPELRTVASVRNDNLWQAGHAASLTYIVAPQDRSAAEVYSASYMAPLNADWNLLASGYKSNSNANTVGGTTVLGKGNAFGFQLVRTLPAHDGYAQSLSVGVTRKHFDQNISQGVASSKTPITYLPLTVSYNGQAAREKSTTSFALAGTFGVRAGGSNAAEFDSQRYNARANFFYLRSDLTHVLLFADGFSLALRGSAQAATSSLVSSEQFAAGGDSTVRGYLEAEDTADHGVIASAELRSPSIAPAIGKWANEWRFHAFVDGAHLVLSNALPQPVDTADPTKGDFRRTTFDLLSAGLGTRFQFFDYLTGTLEVAYPLKDGQATRAHDTRVHFSLRADL
nr:ShlB/FhaC/HecB family hemolysin secretion/activation protein [Luteibacter sp. Sphag1AF]